MFQNPEQFASATKTLFEFQLDTFNSLTSKAVQALEQVAALNLATARSNVENTLATGRELSEAKDPKAVLAVAASKVQPGVADAAAYNQQLSQIIADIQAEFARAAEAHMAEAKSSLSALIYDVTKNVRPGSENAVQIVKQAIDNAFRGYEQVTTATREAVSTFEEQLARASASVAEHSQTRH
ncbi:phasin family protein [Massilia sp. YIM B04103]|uniref:phasin family protein n=1 Tax=Massilia sp. YIM B04103 TaxID=2963106 RepID=UPI00210E82DB|nr:phasin family protein [Massilia sp. YIM B04103]